MFAHLGPNLQLPYKAYPVSRLSCEVGQVSDVLRDAIEGQVGRDQVRRLGGRPYLCEILADILGCCTKIMAERTGITCLACTLAEEFTGNVRGI